MFVFFAPREIRTRVRRSREVTKEPLTKGYSTFFPRRPRVDTARFETRREARTYTAVGGGGQEKKVVMPFMATDHLFPTRFRPSACRRHISSTIISKEGRNRVCLQEEVLSPMERDTMAHAVCRYVRVLLSISKHAAPTCRSEGMPPPSPLFATAKNKIQGKTGMCFLSHHTGKQKKQNM